MPEGDNIYRVDSGTAVPGCCCTREEDFLIKQAKDLAEAVNVFGAALKPLMDDYHAQIVKAYAEHLFAGDLG